MDDNNYWGHLVACTAGFCAVLYAARPGRLAHFQALRELERVTEPDPTLICYRIRLFSARIVEGFDQLEDGSLSRLLPTVFVPEGESVMTLLLGNLEHLINHEHQLFSCLGLFERPLRKYCRFVITGDARPLRMRTWSGICAEKPFL